MSNVISGFASFSLDEARKEAREKELAALNNGLLRLFLLTEVSLGLAAPFLKSDEIGGQSFSKNMIATNIPGISWEFTLSLSRDEGNMPYAAFNTFTIVRKWSYSFWVIFRSQTKEIKFNLKKEDLKRFQAPAWTNFKELYLENDGVVFRNSIHMTIFDFSNKVREFFTKKVCSIQMREGLGVGCERLFELNTDNAVNLIMGHEEALDRSQKYEDAFQAYGPLVFETCQALRDTKGFVKSKKLAEIRENLERKSKEIMASVKA